MENLRFLNNGASAYLSNGHSNVPHPNPFQSFVIYPLFTDPHCAALTGPAPVLCCIGQSSRTQLLPVCFVLDLSRVVSFGTVFRLIL